LNKNKNNHLILEVLAVALTDGEGWMDPEAIRDATAGRVRRPIPADAFIAALNELFAARLIQSKLIGGLVPDAVLYRITEAGQRALAEAATRRDRATWRRVLRWRPPRC
jgi:hypothetical protein